MAYPTSTKGGAALFLLQAFLLQTFITFSVQSVFLASHTRAHAQAEVQEISGQDLNLLIQDMRNNKFFTSASILGFLSPPFLTSRISILIPTDVAIATAVSRGSAISLVYPPVIQFHILERNLSFKQLQLLPLGTWLPTMVPGKGVQVTNTDLQNFTLNNAKIVKPDMCPSVSDAGIVCHGIDKLLDMSSMLVSEPRNPPFPAAPAVAPSAPPAPMSALSASPAPSPSPPPPSPSPSSPPAAP